MLSTLCFWIGILFFLVLSFSVQTSVLIVSGRQFSAQGSCGGFLKHFLLKSDLAATILGALAACFCISFLQKLISGALGNEPLKENNGQNHPISDEVAK